MNSEHHSKLTASEVSNLWTFYSQGTMMVCGLRYFINKVENPDIRSTLENALAISQQHVDSARQIFKQENYPIPIGFTSNDVNIDAPRLFSDNFFLIYTLNMAKFLTLGYGLAAATSAREDIVDFYNHSVDQAQSLHKKAKCLALEKGIYVRPPYIPKPDKPEFVNSQQFLAGWFGERRPLLGIEISNLILNIKRNALGKAMIIGFSQVAQSKEVRKYMERGRDISAKHIEVFSSILNDEYLPAPMTWDHEVSDSTVSPFSDKLIMFHISVLSASGIGQYGMAMSTSPRRDLGTHYTRLSAEIGKFAEDGAKIMIKNGWLEKPPQAADREQLAKEH
jgi:hypothetical protein